MSNCGMCSTMAAVMHSTRGAARANFPRTKLPLD